jgi:hypothetical protein
VGRVPLCPGGAPLGSFVGGVGGSPTWPLPVWVHFTPAATIILWLRQAETGPATQGRPGSGGDAEVKASDSSAGLMANKVKGR